MTWFAPKLDPGERVVCRSAWWRTPYWPVLLVLPVFLPIEFGLSVAGDARGISFEWLLAGLGFAAVSLLLSVVPMAVVTCPRLTVTDRRILYRPWGWPAKAIEIPLAAIESIRHGRNADDIVVSAGPTEITVDGHLIPPVELKQAIERARMEATP